MTTRDDIQSHYTFDSKFYTEHYDPSGLRKPFVDVVSSYPTPAFRPNYNRFANHTYNIVLAPILPSADTLYDFPVSVYLTYLDRISSGRQRIYFRNFHNFFIIVQSFRFPQNAHAQCLAFGQNWLKVVNNSYDVGTLSYYLLNYLLN